jgi:hypothetical protein
MEAVQPSRPIHSIHLPLSEGWLSAFPQKLRVPRMGAGSWSRLTDELSIIPGRANYSPGVFQGAFRFWEGTVCTSRAKPCAGETGSEYGIQTHVVALRGQHPRSLEELAIIGRAGGNRIRVRWLERPTGEPTPLLPHKT